MATDAPWMRFAHVGRVMAVVAGAVAVVGMSGCGNAASSDTSGSSGSVLTVADATTALAAWLALPASGQYAQETGDLQTSDLLARSENLAHPLITPTPVPDRSRQIAVAVPRQTSYPVFFLGIETFTYHSGDRAGEQTRTHFLFTRASGAAIWHIDWQSTTNRGLAGPIFTKDANGYASAVSAAGVSAQYTKTAASASKDYATFRNVADNAPSGAAIDGSEFSLHPVDSFIVQSRMTRDQSASKGLVDTFAYTAASSPPYALELSDGGVFVLTDVHLDATTASSRPLGTVTYPQGDGVTYPKGVYRSVTLHSAHLIGFEIPAKTKPGLVGIQTSFGGETSFEAASPR